MLTHLHSILYLQLNIALLRWLFLKLWFLVRRCWRFWLGSTCSLFNAVLVTHGGVLYLYDFVWSRLHYNIWGISNILNCVIFHYQGVSLAEHKVVVSIIDGASSIVSFPLTCTQAVASTMSTRPSMYLIYIPWPIRVNKHIFHYQRTHFSGSTVMIFLFHIWWLINSCSDSTISGICSRLL